MSATTGSLTVQVGLLLLALGLTSGSVAARRVYVSVELRQVPLGQLSVNLRRAMRNEPRNPQWVHNLARAHAMAWSIRSDSLAVMTGYRGYGNDDTSAAAVATRRRAADRVAASARDVFFGYEPPIVPFTRIASVTDTHKLTVAAAHFDTAMTLYARAIALDSSNLIIRLGQAWLWSQTPDTAGAIVRLRSIVRDVVKPTLPRRQYTFMGGRSVRLEAARYLIPLLDPVEDRVEIASLKEQVFEEENAPRAVTPIAVPLRDGLTARSIEARQASVLFDADGSGLRKPWTWITEDAAWLVHDSQKTGRVTSALQLFGSVTFWMFWSNGYDALASLDDDHDGELRGRELAPLALWHDVNGNGVSEVGEVRSLAAYNIIALRCRGIRDAQHPDRITYSPDGVTFADGTTRSTFDLVLHEAAVRRWWP